MWGDDEADWLREESDQEWAERWITAWDRLEAIGVVGPGDQNMSLAELERIAGQLGASHG